MTPIERSQALQSGETVDRMPIILFHGTIGAKIAGMSYQESNRTAENIAKKEIISYKTYGFDDVSVNYGLTNLGRALGTQFKESKNSAPTITEYILEDIEDFESLEFNLALRENDANVQKHFEALQLIHAKIGDEVECTYDLTGSWTAAASLIDPEQLLRSTRKNREAVHGLLRAVTDTLLAIIDDFSQLSYVRFSLTDPFASGDLISPKYYEEFCLPYTRELVDRIHELSKPVYIHICGDTTKLLTRIAKTGVDAISLDQKVDLSEAKVLVGDKVVLIGNVDPMTYFYHGNSKDIVEGVRECFEKAYDTPKGFIIGAGCSVPYDTPLKNIEAFVEASRQFGKYPINSKKFSK